MHLVVGMFLNLAEQMDTCKHIRKASALMTSEAILAPFLPCPPLIALRICQYCLRMARLNGFSRISEADSLLELQR